MLSLGQRMLVSAAVAFVLGALLYGLLVGWEARHPLRAAAAPTGPLTLYPEDALDRLLVTLSSDRTALTFGPDMPDALRLCAAQPEGDPTCITLAELRERRD